MLQVIGAGYPRTGTRSLCHALQALGLDARHFDVDRIRMEDAAPGYFAGRFNDVDAILDMPATYFWREIAEAYPAAKIILTVREEGPWFDSMVRHMRYVQSFCYPPLDHYSNMIHAALFGVPWPQEYLYRRAYRLHNESVVRAFGGTDRLLVMDVAAGDGWDVLCPFLGRPVPPCPFPWLNKGH